MTKTNDNANRPVAFASGHLTDVEKIYFIGELELLTVLWELENFRFYLYGKLVYLYTDHQALEHSSKLNRAYRQKRLRLTKWLD